MESKRYIWRGWAESIYRWGLKDVVIVLLEALKPISFIIGQALYLLQPFSLNSNGKETVAALAEMMSDPEEMEEFLENFHDS